MGACCGGLRVMLWKNYLLKRRRPGMTTMEILLPAAVAVLMVVIRLVAPVDDDIPPNMNFGLTADNGGVFNLRTDLTWVLYEQWNYPWWNKTGAPLIMKVGMAPDDANSHHLAEHLFNVSMRDELLNNHHQEDPSYLDHFVFFKDNEAIEAYTTDRNYGKTTDGTYHWPLRFAVVLQDWLPLNAPPDQARTAKWEYTMRFNSTVICPPSHLTRQDRMLSCFIDTPDTTADPVDLLGRNRQALVTPYETYHKGAFWIVQNHIDRYIMTRRAGVESGLTDDGQPPYAIVETSQFPERARKEDSFVDITESVMGLFFLMVFLTPFSILVKNLVEEKELKLKEAMRMMGLSEDVFWGSWIVSYIIQFAITALLVTVVGIGTVYEHSDISIVFVFFFLFMLSTFGFATMISAFFDRAKTASTFSSMLMFGIFFPTYVINDPDDSLGTKTLACLSPPVALALGVTKIAQLESIGAGAQWDNIDLVVENFSLGHAMGMLVLDVFLYTLVGIYLTYVIPGKYGTPKPFYFPLLPSFWRECCGCKKAAGDADAPDFDKALVRGDRIEEVPPELRDKARMSLRNLRKEYDGEAGKIVAVAGTNLDLFEGQILALLGHNGAGKSTTISILTGLYPPTSGDALIYGMSVTRDMESIRNILGVCPQEDVLYPTLTVYEHLILYATLRGKGGDQKALDAEIDTLLRELALTEKKHTPSAALSGGQKRKLCTGNAMIGDAKVIFLDEPTSGMDPFARRSFWSFLQKKKEGRVIVLTTHMMDEADCLGDRIAIMAKGRVQCCGSSLFLKRHYGVGYLMTCTMSNPAMLHSLIELVRSNVPEVDEPKVAAIEVQFRLPFSASSAFPSLFTALDLDISDGGRKFGVSTYGVGVTTLEEVFLKVDEDAHDGNRFGQADDKKMAAAGAEVKKAEDGVINVTSPKDSEPFMDWAVGDLADENSSFFLRHFDALLRKRFHNYKRDRRAVIFQIFLPLVVVCIGLALTMAFSLYTFPKVPMTPEQYNSPLPIPFNANPVIPGPSQVCRPVADPWQDCTPFANVSSCGATASCCYQENNWPGCNTCSFCEVHNGAHVGVNTKTLAPLAPFMEPPGIPVPGVNDTVTMGQYLLASVGGYPTPEGIRALEGKNRDLNDCTFLNRFAGTENGRPVIRQRLCFPDSVPFENRNLHKESTFGGFVAPAMRKDFWWSLGNPSHEVQGVSLVINSTATHAVPIFTNLFHNALLRSLVNNTEATIITHNQPLSPTHQEEVSIGQALSFAAVMIFSIAYSFIPASFVMFVIRERETNSKHQQIISGVSIWAYWLSSFVWDFSAYLITATISMGIIAAFDIEELLGEAGGSVFLLLFIYGLAVTAFAYAFSFFFKSPSNGQNAMIFFNFLFGVIAAIVMFVLDRIPSTKEYASPIKYVLRLIPNYCLSDALINLLMRSIPSFWGGPKGPWDFVITGVDYLFLIIGFVVWLSATLIFEKLVSTPRLLRSCEPHHLQPIDTQFKLRGEDSDLVAEREKLIASRSDDEEKRAEGGWIRCEGLMKAYRSPPKVAVKDFWLSVPPGECFGFLGLNGAGKSSVLSMLGVDKVPTRGTAYLKGIDIVQYPERVRRLIGYCPQRDALFELLTAREHLELYARIKGVREDRVKDYVNKVLKMLSLTPWADEVSQAYSGGNKRKLSVGIALIGSPPICFLDEPSSGMDPASRRSMWDLISKTMAGRTVILTTHSMEECEALCPRIGIMVSGRLRCLGSAHHLKQKYGSGYQLDATVGLSKGEEKSSQESPEETRAIVATFKAFVQQQWPTAQLLEEHTNRLKYRLPRDQMPLGAIFSLIEHNRAYLRIDEYSVSETTLEQIFLAFAQQREEELDAVPGLVGAAGLSSTPAAAPAPLVPAHLPPVPAGGPASGSLITVPVGEAEATDIELSAYSSAGTAAAAPQQPPPAEFAVLELGSPAPQQQQQDDGMIG